MRVATPSLPLALVALAASCGSSSSEALVVLQLTAAPDVPSFVAVRLSVVDRPAVRAREAAYDPNGPGRFGYYVPGPDGTATIRVQALAAGCVVGEGTAVVEVRVGQVSAAVPLTLGRSLVDPACFTGLDGSAEPGEAGVRTDAGVAPDASGEDATGGDRPADVPVGANPDGAADARGPDAQMPKPETATPPDVMPPPPDIAPPPPDMAPPPPPCMNAVERCPGAADCCAGLRCGKTSAGQVCCGDFNASCSRPGGEDCCGALECVSGRCCLPPVTPCAGLESSCCGGRICGNTSAGHVCCGLAGAPCTRPGGEDCCGLLECVSGHCR
jgi:hypothetical protein